jgi:hypothetical protein
MSADLRIVDLRANPTSFPVPPAGSPALSGGPRGANR